MKLLLNINLHEPQRTFYHTFRPYVNENCYKDDAKNETSRHQFREDFNSNLENVFGDNYIPNLQKYAYYQKFKNSERVIADNGTLAKDDNSPKMFYLKGEKLLVLLKVLMGTHKRDRNLIWNQCNLLRCSIENYL